MRFERYIPDFCEDIAPSGREDTLRDRIRRIWQEQSIPSLRLEEDALGSLIVQFDEADSGQRTGSSDSDEAQRVDDKSEVGGLLLATALDEPPVLLTHIDESGYLRFHSPLRTAPERLVGAEIQFIAPASPASSGNEHQAVTGIVAIEERRRDERNKLEYHHLVIDAGFRNAEEAKQHIQPGALGAISAKCKRVGSRWVGKALHRAGAAALMDAALGVLEADNRPYGLTLAFAAQSALGGRGSRVIGQRVQPRAAIVVAASPARDLPGMREGSIRLGGGPVIRYLDRNMVSSAKLANRLSRLAASISLPYQVEVSSEGPAISDALQLLISGVGVPTAVIGLPIRHHDQTVQMIDPDDVAALSRLLQAVITTDLEE